MLETQSMKEAVLIAKKIADKNDNVLLSPACASFDLFENYEDRGNQFKQAVKRIVENKMNKYKEHHSWR